MLLGLATLLQMMVSCGGASLLTLTQPPSTKPLSWARRGSCLTPTRRPFTSSKHSFPCTEQRRAARSLLAKKGPLTHFSLPPPIHVPLQIQVLQGPASAHLCTTVAHDCWLCAGACCQLHPQDTRRDACTLAAQALPCYIASSLVDPLAPPTGLSVGLSQGRACTATAAVASHHQRLCGCVHYCARAELCQARAAAAADSAARQRCHAKLQSSSSEERSSGGCNNVGEACW